MNLIQDAASQATDAILNNQKAAIAVPVGTAAIGTLSALAEIQSWLTVISMGLGIIISSVILWHRLITVKTAHLEHRAAQLRLLEITKHQGD